MLDGNNKVAIQLEQVVDIVYIVQDKDSSSNSDDKLERRYLLESEESIRLIDSIAGNADITNLY